MNNQQPHLHFHGQCHPAFHWPNYFYSANSAWSVSWFRTHQVGLTKILKGLRSLFLLVYLLVKRTTKRTTKRTAMFLSCLGKSTGKRTGKRTLWTCLMYINLDNHPGRNLSQASHNLSLTICKLHLLGELHCTVLTVPKREAKVKAKDGHSQMQKWYKDAIGTCVCLRGNV